MHPVCVVFIHSLALVRAVTYLSIFIPTDEFISHLLSRAAVFHVLITPSATPKKGSEGTEGQTQKQAGKTPQTPKRPA